MKAPTCRDLGFALGPRINAGGRVGKSDLGVRLLTTADPEEARTIAAELDRLNEERRAIEMIVGEQAGDQAAAQANDPLIIVSGSGWHAGVVGIVASRLKERFGGPALVIALDEAGVGKGSGRSISGVDLGAAVLAAKDSGLLVAGGGTPWRPESPSRQAASSRCARSSMSGSPPRSRPRGMVAACCSTRWSRPAASRQACATRLTRQGLMAPVGRHRASLQGRRDCSRCRSSATATSGHRRG